MESFLLTRGELACVRRAGEAGCGRGDHLCACGDRSCLARRGGVPHLGRRQRVWRCGRRPYAGCVLGAGQGDGVLTVPGRGSSMRDSYSRAEVLSALGPRSCARCQTCPVPGPLMRAVGCSFPRVVRDAGELVGPGGVGPGGTRTPLIDPGYPHACEGGRGSDAACRHGLIWDHTVFHVVPHWRARPKIVAPFDAQLSDRPADRPGPQTRPGCAHRVILLDEGRDLAGAFAAHPASYCATGSAPEPRPKGASITSTTTRP